jgi:hypothetical protein
MTVSEACQLVLEAAAIGKNGQTLFFDMGKPVRIADIARRMIILSGLKPDIDIQINYTGMRPGEKLNEDLLCDERFYDTTYHPKIRIARIAPSSFINVETVKTLLTEALESGKTDQMVALLKLMIPEYISNNSDFQKLDNKRFQCWKSENYCCGKKARSAHPLQTTTKPFRKCRYFQISVFAFGINVHICRDSLRIERLIEFDTVGNRHHCVVTGVVRNAGGVVFVTCNSFEKYFTFSGRGRSSEQIGG